MDFTKLCAKVFEKWGLQSQLNQMSEECGEYVAALNRWRRGRTTHDTVLEEIADVSLLCDEMLVYFPQIADYKAQKIARLESLIEAKSETDLKVI